MNTRVIKAAVVGFVTGVLGMFALFFFFSVPQGVFAKFINVALILVCPPLLHGLAGPPWEIAVVPLLNAALYGLAAYAIGIVRPRHTASRTR